jgi:hypothetical protein
VGGDISGFLMLLVEGSARYRESTYQNLLELGVYHLRIRFGRSRGTLSLLGLSVKGSDGGHDSVLLLCRTWRRRHILEAVVLAAGVGTRSTEYGSRRLGRRALSGASLVALGVGQRNTLVVPLAREGLE